MTTTTLYGYSETVQHAGTNGGTAYAAGTQGNSATLYTRTQLFERVGYRPAKFTRSNYATVSGTNYYLFALDYMDQYNGNGENGSNNTPTKIRVGDAGDTPADNEILIPTGCFSMESNVPGGPDLDLDATPTNPQPLYLKLFDTSSQGITTEHNVLLSFAGNSEGYYYGDPR